MRAHTHTLTPNHGRTGRQTHIAQKRAGLTQVEILKRQALIALGGGGEGGGGGEEEV